MSAATHPFPVRGAWAILAGGEVDARLQADKVARVKASDEQPGCFESESLCAWQSEMHGRGYITAQLTESNYGWSVRSSSGLDNFGILAGVRRGDLTGTFLDALCWAREWQRIDPTKRVVTCYADRLCAENIRTWENTFREPELRPDPEPDQDDSVKCCPDCEKPNQFGEVCPDCQRDRAEDPK